MIGGKVELEDVVEEVLGACLVVLELEDVVEVLVVLVDVVEEVVGRIVVVLLELVDVVGDVLVVLVDVVEEVVGGAVVVLLELVEVVELLVVLVEVVLVLVEVVVGVGTTGVSVLHSPLPGTPAKRVATFPPVASIRAVPLPSSSRR